MAGYRRQNTIYNLTFAEHEGLEISIRGLSTGQLMELWSSNSDANSGDKVVVAKATDKMLHMFVGALIEWNLEDENGDAVPKTVEGMKAQDLSFVLALTNGWSSAISGTSEELGKDSDSGKQFQGELIPMETL